MNKTIKELMDEAEAGKRLGISRDEFDAARDYERSLLPPGTIFPRNNEIWESRSECEVTFFAEYSAPGGGPSGRCRFPGHERVKIIDTPEDRSIFVGFVPLANYRRLQNLIIPQKVRKDRRYVNYWLWVGTAEFNAHFERI